MAGALALGALALPAGAATDVHPAGGGQFSGGPEGWEVTSAECNVPVLCTASGGYDGGDGRPAGSLAANTNVSLNLLSLFKSTVVLQSPDFVASSSGPASVHLERRFTQGSLVDLSPQLDYRVQLIDRTSGKRSTVISETLADSAGWSGEDGAATLKSGRTYALAITAVTSSNVAGAGLLSGSTSARFDNVALTVADDGTNGGGKGAGEGAGGPTIAARVAALAPATLAGPAQMKGKRLFVKARCPAKIGRACRVSVLGLLKKRKPATANRTVKVAKGKTKRLVLRVKPRAKGKVVTRKRLLFKVRVRAGKAQATAFKRLRLIRR
ncbi:MAG TPA: hypothetical protein VFT79_12455 [Solirubrobacterales bacterium]|nr:hypothetical protein [Solirubrobacterales bacterium]